MKKIVTLMLCLLVLCMAGSALAAEGYPGETVTVSFSGSSSESPCAFEVPFSFDSSVLTFVSASGAGGVTPPGGANGRFVYYGTSPFAGGSMGSITFKIAENAPAGTYKVSASLDYATDINDNDISMSVSGGSVTVLKVACEHTYGAGTVTTPATCAKAGVKTFT